MPHDSDELAARLDSAASQLPPINSVSQLLQCRKSHPVPLVRPVPPAAPYPIDALGPILGPDARAIMENVQVPDALAGHSVLSFAALAAQPVANVQTLGKVIRNVVRQER